MHSCPVVHAGCSPHWQTPLSEQESATLELQKIHAFPLMPQVDVDRPVHTPSAQQPSGHEVASHMQAPSTQCCPVPQDAPSPHMHTPLPEQVSALVVLHFLQAAPPVPQVAMETV